MTFKVVRNAQGVAVAFGPNDDNYEPSMPYVVEDTAPQLDPSIALLSQIESMERKQLMPRATREFMLMFMEANAPAEVLSVNPGYQAVKAFDNQIVALRAQLPV